MKRILLYSSPDGKSFSKILDLTFPKSIKNKILAYMPSNGANTKQKYTDKWEKHAKDNNTVFVFIDNLKRNDEAKKEINKLLSANILVITGGNTFALLDNLQKSGLAEAVVKFSQKPEFVLSGFSAGAIVLTPTIATSSIKGYDENLVGIKDLTGLGIVDFEVFAHYSKQWKKAVKDYEKSTTNEVKKLSDEDYIEINL